MSDAGSSNPVTFKECFRIYVSNPVVFLAVLMLGSVIALIGAAVLGIDKGVLSGMAKAEYARGLITYLFAVVTIGVAVAIVLYALVSTGEKGEREARFQNAKEVLALLLGLFGTIVGFYFGSEASKSATAAAVPLQVSSLDVAPQTVSDGAPVIVRAAVLGGAPPYRFALGQEKAPTELREIVPATGWIIKQLNVSKGANESSGLIFVVVKDANDKTVEQVASVQIQ